MRRRQKWRRLADAPLRLNIDRSTAREWMEVARALESLPEISSVFESGRISWDQLRQVVRIATPETDHEWSELVLSHSPSELRRCLRQERAARRPESEEQVGDGNWVEYSWNPWKEELDLKGHLMASDGAIVAKALDLLAEDQPPREDGTFASWERRAAAALVELASQKLSEVADAPRATIVVHVNAEDLAKDLASAEVDGAVFINSEAIREMACDSKIQLVLEDKDGKPLGVGRTTRKVPTWLMRQLRHRDGGCRFSGGRKRFLHAHHIVPWEHGGPTDLNNLILLCGAHHRMVHKKKWKVEFEGGRVRFLKPDGTPIQTGPAPLRREVALRLFPEELVSIAQ